MSALLEVRGVDFAYPDGTRALRDATAAFAEGACTAVLGGNGAGKSSLLLLLNAVYRPRRGTVWFRGRPLGYGRSELAALRRRVGLVFQDPDVQLFAASVREDVSFGPTNLGLSRPEVEGRVERALAAVGLGGLADRPAHALSFGEKRRACLAGVLALEPEVLVLDEPTAGLDAPMCRELEALLASLRARGSTVIFATHDVDLAYAWADRVTVLAGGSVTFQGTPEELWGGRGETPGLAAPWVREVWRGLAARGLVPPGPPPPRSREALLGLLGAAPT